MDQAVPQGWERQRELREADDFARLFAELDRADAVAPIGDGLRRMMTSVDGFRRRLDGPCSL